MKVFTSAFKNNEKIPAKFTCDGEDINPEIFIEDVSKEARSLVLIVDDPDSPSGNWSHCVIWNIDPKISLIKQGELPAGSNSGVNDFGKRGYGGPCPSRGEHRYFFKIFALSEKLFIPDGSTKNDVESAMKDLILEKSEFVGLYSRL